MGRLGGMREVPGERKLGPNSRPLNARMENLDSKFLFFILRNSVMPSKQRSNVVRLKFWKYLLTAVRKVA